MKQVTVWPRVSIPPITTRKKRALRGFIKQYADGAFDPTVISVLERSARLRNTQQVITYECAPEAQAEKLDFVGLHRALLRRSLL